jgi:hypothetical protein
LKSKNPYGCLERVKMVYTYLIQYDGIDGFGSIEFCAENKKEAISLFNQWCVEDNKMPTLVPFKSIEIIYNYDDAEEYTQCERHSV